MPIGQSTGPRVLRHSATRHFKKTPEAVCCMNSYLVVSFSEGGNARHFFFGPLFVAGSRLQAMLFQTFKLAHSAKVRRETGNKKKGACACFLRRGKCSPFFFLARSSLQAPGSRPCFSNIQTFNLSNFQTFFQTVKLSKFRDP